MIDATTDLAQLPERVIRIKSPHRAGKEGSCFLNLVAVEQRVRLDTVVGLLNASVGVVNRSDANLLRLADLQACPNAIFKVEGRSKILVTCGSAREHRNTDTGFDEGFNVAVAKLVNEHRGERQRVGSTGSVPSFPIGVASIPITG